MGVFLDYQHDDSDGVHTYHFSAEFAGDCLWRGLFEVYSEDRSQSPYFRFAINNNDGEALAVWRALAWTITSGRSRFAIPRYYRDDAAKLLDTKQADVTMVDWEYAVDAEPGSRREVDHGFVPARSAIPIRPRPTGWEKAHKAKAGLFELRDTADLVTMSLAVGGDASSEINIFGLAGINESARLIGLLTGSTRPDLGEILGDGGVFVNLSIDHDGYGRSHMMVKARQPLPELQSLTNHYREAFERYRETVDAIDDFDQFAAAVSQLLAPPADHPLD